MNLEALASKAEELAGHLRAAAELRAELGLEGPTPPQQKARSQPGAAERARKRQVRGDEGQELARELVKLCGNQATAARALGIDPSTLALYLRGRRAPRKDRLEQLRRTVAKARRLKDASFPHADPPAGQENVDHSKRSSAA